MSWDMVKLGDIVTFKGGGTPSRKNPDFWNGAIPWASVKDFVSNRLDSTTEFITDEGLKKSASNLIPPNTLIMPTRMALGKIAINTVPLAINQDLKALFVNEPKRVDKKYLALFLSYKSDYIVQNGSGATVKGITLDFLRDVPIPLPPIEPQKRIVELLDRAQALIDRRKEQIKLMDDLIQSLFYDMFGDPVTNSMGWDIVALSKICEFENGDRSSKYPSKTDIVNEGVLFFGTKNIGKDGFFSDKSTKYITEGKFRSLSQGKLKKGDLVISLRGSIGECCLFDYPSSQKGFNNAQLMILRCLSKINNSYLHRLLRLPSRKRLLLRLGSGSAVPQITASQMKSLTVPIPPVTLQNTFAKRVEKIEAQKQAMTSSLKELENNFNSLMQRAFKGELDRS